MGVVAPRQADAVQLRRVARRISAVHPELAAVVALAAVLNLWRLSQNGWANRFYSAADRSMSASWHNFVYAALDPSGVMTVDKPPLALWVQALSVRLFGYHPLSVLVPQALMGVLSVALVYDLTRRRFGRGGGFAAGLVLALTPITVAVSRHNNPDALLALCAVAAVWCIVRALEQGAVRWLVLAGVCVGLGFETKMGAVLVVVPGLALAWLWAAPNGRLRAVGELAAAGVAAAAVALAWPIFIALGSPLDRPWISGTGDNSIWSLITNYNGLGRVTGQAGGPGLFTAPSTAWVFGGAPGPLRLLNESLGIQAGWFAGLALVGAVAIAIACRMRRRDARSSWLLAIGGGFLACAVVFSTARGIFHPYYVSLLAPFTAALTGACLVQLVEGRSVAARLVAGLAVVAGVLAEIAVIDANPTQPAWLVPVLLAGGLVVAALLAALANTRVRAALVALALLGMLAAPATAAVQTLGHRTNGTFPAGGPTAAVATVPGSIKQRLRLRSHLDRLELVAVRRYIATHGGGTLGVRSQSQAAEAIVADDARIAGLGGWSGDETEMSPAWLGSAVRRHEVRWVMFNGRLRLIPGRRVGVTRLLRAVAATCRKVPRAGYTPRVRIARGALYDCRGHARALARAGGAPGLF